MYSDEIRIKRVVYEEVEGANVATYPLPPEAPIPANVQSERVDRIEPGSDRITVVYLHRIYTPGNRSLRADDQVEYIDKSGANHVITVVAPSSPRGVGDVAFETVGTEVT
jgi:hypothetical protein